jgi:TetR/AcrR family transcriptional regulator, copper-responsive repressor
MREFAILPDEAYGAVTESRFLVQHQLAMNIEIEKTEVVPSVIAEMMLSFFSGLCIERNLKSGKASSTRTVGNFMAALKNL